MSLVCCVLCSWFAPVVYLTHHDAHSTLDRASLASHRWLALSTGAHRTFGSTFIFGWNCKRTLVDSDSWLFWRVLSGDVFQPADGGDLVSFLFPTYRFAASQISQWTLPLWNPHLYGGARLLAISKRDFSIRQTSSSF